MSDLAARTTEVAPVREAGGRLADDLRAVRVVWRRELIRFLRNRARMGTALVPPILFLLVLGSGLARMMPNAGAGIDFRTFMFPGVLAMTVLFTSIFSAVSIFLDREFGFMREMLVLAGLVHVPYDPALMGLLVLEMALAALALTAIGTLIASRVARIESFQVVIQFLVLPMFFLSGALFPLSNLPRWLTALTLLDPLSYAVDPMRRAVFSHITAPPALSRLLDPGISWGGWLLPTAAELGLVALLAAVALAFAGARFSRTEYAFACPAKKSPRWLWINAAVSWRRGRVAASERKGAGTVATVDDLRFDVPAYTVEEAATFLGVPRSTFSTWAHGYVRRPGGQREVRSAPLITAIPAAARLPRIPFVGLAEGMVAAAFRKAGVSMQHLRRSLLVLQQELGVEHALASGRLYTDGSSILYDYATRHGDEEILTVVLTGQRVFSDVIRDYLQRITYAQDDWAERIVLPITPRHVVEVDPNRAFGQPVFVRGGARMKDVLDRFRAGEPLASVAQDFDLESQDLEDAIRAALPPAA